MNAFLFRARKRNRTVAGELRERALAGGFFHVRE